MKEYKENKIDTRKFRTKYTDNCPVCGRKLSKRRSKRRSADGKTEFLTILCGLCGTLYKLNDGVRDDSYVPIDTENYCDFNCSLCIYYDCVRSDIECVQFEEFLDSHNISSSQYEKLLKDKKIKPFIRGRKNKGEKENE